MLKWLWLSCLVILLDQLSKQLIEYWLIPGQPLMVTPFFNLLLVYNTGAAFSFLSSQSGWQRWFLSGLAVMVAFILAIWLRQLTQKQRLEAIGLSLIIGGAIGNLIDRLFYRQVTDFIQLHYAQWAWPAFNIADSAITLGVILLLVHSWFGKH